MTRASLATIVRMPEDVGYPLRLPAELKAKLTVWARHERRSLNAQIVFLLEKAVDQVDPTVVVVEQRVARRDALQSEVADGRRPRPSRRRGTRPQ